MDISGFPILLFVACVAGLAVFLLLLGNLFGPSRTSSVKRMPYESGMDPIHDTRRRFDVRFHLVAIAFLVFDVELLFLYPWAVALHPQPPHAAMATEGSQISERAPEVMVAQDQRKATSSRPSFVFAGGMVFILLLGLGLIYDWKKGIFHWR
jgi:NADH-quinone oxidoreductase subunit A